MLDNEFPRPGDDDGVISKVAMLEQYSIVFLMNTDRVLDGPNTAGSRREMCVQVVNRPLAIATQRKTVSHVSSAILS